MPETTLTEITIRNLKPPEKGQVTHLDKNLPGFGLRVSQGGARSFVLLIGRQRKRVTIGRYPIISLADARTEAKRLLAQHTLGKHRPQTVAFNVALEQYKQSHLATLRARTAAETHRLLKRHFLPKFRHTKLEDLSPSDISDAIDKLPTPSITSHAFAALRGFLRWARRRNYVSRSPMEGMKAPARQSSRSRVLTLKELATVYRKAGEGHIGTIIRLLILTGQRRGEIAALRGEYIDKEARTIDLPKEATKNKRPHLFPIGELTLQLLEGSAEKGLLFPARGKDTPFNGWSKSKPEIAIPHWTLHDLRRSFSTHLSSFGVPPHVTERLLNHVHGTLTPIAQTYNRYHYIDEMREAINLWEQKLSSLITDVPVKVPDA